MKRNDNSRVCFLASAIAVIAFASLPASADGFYGAHSQAFRFIFPLSGIGSYPVDEMVENCGGTYDDAQARIWVRQRDGKTHLKIHVTKSVPDTLWTIWLRLDQPSELTGAPITALANSHDTAALAAITPAGNLTQTANDLGLKGDDGSGSKHAANVFWTDRWGNGSYYAKLDYPLVKGAFQFNEFDATLARNAIGDGPLGPVAHGVRLRLASHCFDQRAHGLVPGKHEMWFDWK